MGSESASPDAERRKVNDSRPPALAPKPEGTGSSGAGVPRAADANVRPQAVQTKTVVGTADDHAERQADQAADKVMRTPGSPRPPTPVSAAATRGPAAAPPAGALAPTVPSSAAPATRQPLRRAEDPDTHQKTPGTPAVQPVSSGSAGGNGPDTTTPAGPAPLVSAPIAAGAKPAESGIPAADPEPPAPEGEAPARETPAVSPELQQYLDASRGKGAPLPEVVRTVFEAKFQRPFGDVRIHDDAGADNAARNIDALAFTRGNDIYFRSGAYDPVSAVGKRLLAHELAHIVQNRPGINRRATSTGGPLIRRKAGDTKGALKKVDVAAPKGTIDIGSPQKTLTLDVLTVPTFKKGDDFKPKPIRWRRSNEKRLNKQRDIWRDNALAGTKTSVHAKLDKLKLLPPGPYELQGKADGKSSWFFVGEFDDIAAALTIPPWNRSGTFARWEVDHKAEWQIGGDDEIKDNFWLLDPDVNRQSGDYIKKSIREQLDTFLKEANKKLSEPQTVDGLKGAAWTVTWGDVKGVGGPKKTNDESWDLSEVSDIKFMAGLEKLPKSRRDELRGTENRLAIYRQRGGGQVRHVELKGGKGTYESKSRGTQLKAIVWDKPGQPATDGPVGMVSGDILKENKVVKKLEGKLEVPILAMPGVEWGGFLDRQALYAKRAKLLQLAGLSPVTFDTVDFDLETGLGARGVVPKPDLKLLENVTVAVFVENGEVGVEATLAADELKLPGPFKVLGGALTLSAGTGGLAVDGRVDFKIERLATGYLRAGASGARGSAEFELEGGLKFDTKMFTQADLALTYKGGKWGVTGELEVGPGKIKGIKSASAKVNVSDETVSATGEFVPALKGIEKGTLGFKYNAATGMEITGEILLSQGTPGIKSGKLTATVEEGPDKHSLSGDVTLEPSVPGLTGQATGRYKDGAFLVDADLGYEKGFAKGTVHLGVTNQPIGADGKPAGEPKPDGSLVVYGDGSVTLQLTPWLVGTVGMKLSPDGQIEVSGEVALPPTFTVFDEKSVEKELLSLHLDIPIIGVAVAGQRIGIFATIGGSLKANAGLGPGVLRDVALKVTYNPAKPEATTVTGQATFAIPAHAALRLTVEGALGAGIPVVSATAGLQVFGEIGVAGELSAASKIIWTPTAGVVLDAYGSMFVEPKFKFGIDAFVDVSADLWLTTIELYHQTWHLAAFEYGSNLRFGLALPLHYESGKPFSVSFDQIHWTYPHIEPRDLIGGLVKQIVG